MRGWKETEYEYDRGKEVRAGDTRRKEVGSVVQTALQGVATAAPMGRPELERQGPAKREREGAIAQTEDHASSPSCGGPPDPGGTRLLLGQSGDCRQTDGAI